MAADSGLLRRGQTEEAGFTIIESVVASPSPPLLPRRSYLMTATPDLESHRPRCASQAGAAAGSMEETDS